MSFTKTIFEENIINNVQKINTNTINDNDITPLLDAIDNTITIMEKLTEIDQEISGLWNEITSDVIASVNSATAGFYRQAIITLRSILELGCMSFYYLDHKIEYHLFKTHDAKADKYVSTLIRDYDFFTTNYIHASYPSIKDVQKENNSVSNYLNNIYKQLSDVVHGRFKTLTKQQSLKIQYDKEQFQFYINKLTTVIGIFAAMYILKNNGTDDNKLIDLANNTGVVTL
ncbi:hypothetical protein NC661_04435 [Aquibacillus koreensis]|uniref:Uncharacterized protein n=1 Tax=Aquibacillus koreensis TaxID=279446 RepID=A0A9X3WLX3_9BACI|nr:hypothetical protein [Aquibacillus koreensis]MCT2534778.1 hypothetical protein [Aquibacillus koreensis]MDC3419611.1 hypothetical protein [Aquibacillus koreensis]